MAIVLDYTFRIDPAALKAAGVSGVCRYLKPDSAPTYRIGLAEYRELLAAGIDVTLNWEYDALDWLGGASRGASHGSQAVAQAKALGYPAGKVIVGSADFNMTRTQWDGSGHAYAQAFAAAVRAAGYRPGVYGPWDVLTWVRDAGLMDAFWQAGMSTSWSAGRNASAWPGAHLRQRGHKTVAGQDTDWNEILIPDWGGDMLADERAWVNNADKYGWAAAAMLDPVPNVQQANGQAGSVPNLQAQLLKRTEAKVDAVLKALGVAQADLDELQARPVLQLTDEQAAGIADRIATALAAHPATPLGDADKPAIVEAVKTALREGLGQ